MDGAEAGRTIRNMRLDMVSSAKEQRPLSVRCDTRHSKMGDLPSSILRSSFDDDSFSVSFSFLFFSFVSFFFNDYYPRRLCSSCVRSNTEKPKLLAKRLRRHDTRSLLSEALSVVGCRLSLVTGFVATVSLRLLGCAAHFAAPSRQIPSDFFYLCISLYQKSTPVKMRHVRMAASVLVEGAA